MQYLGYPPMRYLASWMLRESNRTVALDVGYDSEAAFSRAFKRMVGMSRRRGGKRRPVGRR